MRGEDSKVLLKNIGLRIAELRLKRGWSRETFAERLGNSWRYVGRIEGGRQNVTVHKLAQLAGALGVKVIDLFASPGIDEIPVGRPAGKSTR